MASSSNSNSNDNDHEKVQLLLPEDIMFQILLWLPVVSLLRFKSVCKSWYSLIKSSQFISQHKHKKATITNLLLMLPRAQEIGHSLNFKVIYSSSSSSSSSSYSNLSGGGSGSSSDINNNNNNIYQTYENLDLPEYFKNKDWDIRWAKMICCDGIICLNHQQWDVSLWNPATKQFRILPRSPLPLPQIAHGHFMFIGFGFDVKTNDYKVIRFAFYAPGSSKSGYNQIEVYSLNNNSWKTLDFVLPINFVISDPKMPYHNGGEGQVYCWMGKDFHQGGIIRILSFDFSKEIFATVPLPNDPTFQSDRIPQLAILREKLAIINGVNFLSEIHAWHYQIWVMNEFGIRESWTKLYTVGPFSFSQPIGFPKNEDFFLLVKDRLQLCLCDPITQHINNLPARDISLKVQAAVYKESLLPV
ncbi:hypothetical protein AQUCO_00400611v1 [Aquilegia coerulea]|uniref:F-box domain-containing protein n=1 Tax=Aquilegia coerulea TaxID=218851 RepID=A0A2G5EVV7_AQUCA|nr:hypothetical protein AQUCO_00400611v1 [Aquilegia coerulea]PIA59853.1 hypothetical protein AQUCO_00400611v1 [Aquilegia coerulea]